MLKVTFQTQRGGIYWAVCASLSYESVVGSPLLDSVTENSRGTGPWRLMQTLPEWQLLQAEQV